MISIGRELVRSLTSEEKGCEKKDIFRPIYTSQNRKGTSVEAISVSDNSSYPTSESASMDASEGACQRYDPVEELAMSEIGAEGAL